MFGLFAGKRFPGLILLLGLLAPVFPVYSEVTDFSYSTLDTHREKRFRIAFWQDPDLSELEFSYGSFQEKLRRLGRELETVLKGPLIQAGFGDIKISVISDYESLLEERTFGRFHLLHCDPAVYLLAKNETFEPYTVLLEEVSKKPMTSSQAVIWVTKESTFNDPRDLLQTNIAVVDSYSLFGGAIQWARLSKGMNKIGSGPAFQTVSTGAVSEAVFRLVTGLGTENPIRAAFLPAESVGFQVAAQMMGLKRVEDLPIRILRRPTAIPLPGNPLLVDDFLMQSHPELREPLIQFFENQKLPWMWQRSSEERYEPLMENLAPLRSIGEDSP